MSDDFQTLKNNAFEAFNRREREHAERMASDTTYRAGQELLEAHRRRVRWESNLRRLRAAGLPERGLPEILGSTYERTSLVTRVEDFITGGDGRGGDGKLILVLAGQPGCGKTFAAALAAAQASETCHRHGDTPDGMPHVRFRHIHEIARLEKYGRFLDEDMSPLHQTCFLVVDDMGVENLNDALRAALDALIDFRYANGRRTLITTNLPRYGGEKGPGFRERYGERIHSRLLESGSYYETTAPSRRGVR